MPAHPDPIARTARFEKKIHGLAPNTCSATRQAASNPHFLGGTGGVVVIDTAETTQAAETVLADFRKGLD